jgi:hypothetical protein
MSIFPLSAAVAVVGSRHGSPFGVAQFAAAVIQSGGSVITGCAPGVDSAAVAAAAAAGRPASVFRSASFAPRDLATRTRLVIHAAAAVAVFPPASGELGPGSALALRLALARRVPVFVAGAVAPAVGWQPVTVAGVRGWASVSAVQSLF